VIFNFDNTINNIDRLSSIIKNLNKEYYIDLLNHNQKFLLKIFLMFWMSVNIIFWLWWFQEHHVINLLYLFINTIGLLYTFIFPGYLFFFATRMKKTNPALEIPSDWKVAMVVTKAPSERFDMVRKTLEGMLRQKFPHDTWLADEDPQPETIAWCKKNSVQISCRKGVSEYNRDNWPRRKKCKEGNLSYFYDKYGYKNYDFVCQLDADHIPQPNYLENMLRPFIDKSVGYVSAPSICSKNEKSSWVARARLYSEAALHGIQQAGQTNRFAPFCFGSHYAVRTKALESIGGLGPELAEDHSTTMIMNANGWKGVHAIDAIAIGDGPETFYDAMIQEFQWSRSLTNILLMWTPKYLKRLSIRLKLQFVFSQIWYSIFSFSMFVGFLIPVYAIINQSPLVKVQYFCFLVFNLAHILFSLLILRYLKNLNLFRPIDAKIFSWEIAVFQIARWPWTLFGVISSFIDFLRKKEFKFKVTPKNQKGVKPLPIIAILPYLIFSIFLTLIGLITEINYDIRGYYYFLITAAMMHIATLWVILLMHYYENRQTT
jgi:cellulose synthase (UDP-forming)